MIVDQELFNEHIQIERKTFSFTLRENPRGRFLKITEDVSGRRDTIIIPSTGLDKVDDVLQKILKADRAAGPCKVAEPPD